MPYLLIVLWRDTIDDIATHFFYYLEIIQPEIIMRDIFRPFIAFCNLYKQSCQNTSADLQFSAKNMTTSVIKRPINFLESL